MVPSASFQLVELTQTLFELASGSQNICDPVVFHKLMVFGVAGCWALAASVALPIKARVRDTANGLNLIEFRSLLFGQVKL